MFKTLVVEDNVSFQETLITLLKEHFSAMEFEKAASGEEALSKTGQFSPQLIFLDIHLPGQNGLQVSRTLRSRYKHATIIMLTNHDGPEYRSAATQCGADFFLSKEAASVDEILGLVETVVSGSETTH